MSEDKSEVTMTRKEYDALVAKAAGDPTPTASGPQYDQRGFKTVEGMEKADVNGDGYISVDEMDLHLEFRRKELEDADLMRDAQRHMAWFSLVGMLLYPFAVVAASYAGLDEAQKTLGSMAPTYFVAVAGIVAAFFGAQAWGNKGK